MPGRTPTILCGWSNRPFLQTIPMTSVLRPPGAALDDQTLDALPDLGVSTLVAGPATGAVLTGTAPFSVNYNM